MRLIHAGGSVTLRLAGYGRGDKLQQPRPARLSGAGNRIEYRRAGLTEWYVNDTLGLEQGFKLAGRPADPHGEPLVIALDLAGGLRPKRQSLDEVVLLDSADHAVLRYGDLKAWDSKGRRLE